MSQISYISSEYENLVKVTDEVNNAIIAIKKYTIIHFGKIGELPNVKFSGFEYAGAKAVIHNLLTQLLDTENIGVKASIFLSDEDVLKLKNRILIIDSYFDDKAKVIIGKLKQDLQMQEDEFDLLDEVVTLLDIDRTLLFRELMSKRG